jgi:hypothetical protein
MVLLKPNLESFYLVDQSIVDKQDGLMILLMFFRISPA